MIHQEPKVGSLQLVEAVAKIYLLQQLISPQITHRDEVDGALRSLDRTVHVSSSSSMLFERKTSPLHGMFYVSDKEGNSLPVTWLAQGYDENFQFNSRKH